MTRRALLLVLTLALPALAAPKPRLAPAWRAATAAEIAPLIPARAPVIAERIETEATSASGVTDDQGHFILGVVLITAGYSANGKYADFLVVQAPIRVGDALMTPGNYLLGWTRDNDSLLVTLSEAATGKPVVTVPARRNEAIHRVEQLHVWPPPHGMIQLGRFTFDYTLAEK